MVTAADDGGQPGRLRKEMGVIPRGYPKCIMALADAEPVMDKLMQYRFKGRRSVRAEPGAICSSPP